MLFVNAKIYTMLEVTDTTIKQFNYKLAVFICDSESETDADAGPEPTLT